MKRAYCSGPMRGKPNLNRDAFDEVKQRALDAGYEVVSPPDLDADNPTDDLGTIVERDIKALLTCDTIIMLPGWQHSVGARAELGVALFRQMKILDAHNLKPLGAELVGVVMPPGPRLVGE